ncbi:hypothetical protein NMY22_g19894 [Coprinellus aureogranulatus]|nr:hypothetical protein NMY22_g19894 [Coprinellus aureogranulatus]
MCVGDSLEATQRSPSRSPATPVSGTPPSLDPALQQSEASSVPRRLLFRLFPSLFQTPAPPHSSPLRLPLFTPSPHRSRLRLNRTPLPRLPEHERPQHERTPLTLLGRVQLAVLAPSTAGRHEWGRLAFVSHTSSSFDPPSTSVEDPRPIDSYLLQREANPSLSPRIDGLHQEAHTQPHQYPHPPIHSQDSALHPPIPSRTHLRLRRTQRSPAFRGIPLSALV